MAVLPDAARRALWARFMAENTGPLTITKAELRAAVDAIDGYIDANGTAMNQAIPQPARGALSAGQKALLFAWVALRRYEEGG
jgi:hypothetical protein